ncbi:MAG: tyrosine-protein phosphatase [Treponema sp.]|jgi:hypothetical protein|nr:tyrosine-protein phosphatase [Treponema sp.]
MADFLIEDTGNFREIRAGNIVRGILFRSEHPVQNGIENKPVVLSAIQARIACVINLCDSGSGVKIVAHASPWYNRLVKQYRVIGLNMSFDFAAPEFNKKLRRGLLFMLSHDGPYLIHCRAGVDRTGFVCAVLEALMGGTMDEIAADYARSFLVGAESDVYHGDFVTAVIFEQLALTKNSETSTFENLTITVEHYVAKTLGLGAEMTAMLKKKLCGTTAT